MTDAMPRFHLAFPVNDLDAAREFYGGVLGCPEGRSDETWVDFDLYGHQIVAHLGAPNTDTCRNAVDGHSVPVPHFGLILSMDAFWKLAERLQDAVTFEIAPHTRFEGQPGEQATMFFRDPCGNAIEFKAFADDGQIFAPNTD